MFLLCYAPGMGGFSLNLGDILCIVAAIAGSLHIILVEKVAKNDNVDSTLFTVFLLSRHPDAFCRFSFSKRR